jgi:hypothetical protein
MTAHQILAGAFPTKGVGGRERTFEFTLMDLQPADSARTAKRCAAGPAIDGLWAGGLSHNPKGVVALHSQSRPGIYGLTEISGEAHSPIAAPRTTFGDPIESPT